jgi:uncharacterized protein
MLDPGTPFTTLSRPARWVALLTLSVVLTSLLMLARIPAALLLGPMIAAILIGTGGALRVPRLPRYGAQAIIGCMIAGTITPAIVGTFAKHWPVFVGVIMTIIGASNLLGWGLSRLRFMPGTTAIWGLAPGGASAMTLMAEAFGADARLVAFMQYLRVVFVAAIASVIGRLWIHTSAKAAGAIIWFSPIDWLPFAETLAIALFGGILGRLSRLPAGVMLVPMFVGSALHGSGVVEIVLPKWLLSMSYGFLGWSIGLGFTRDILAHAMRTLPQTLLSILAMIAFCGGLAFILVRTLGIDPLTAYLATSPGGMDSVAIIGASSTVDLSFVMALQTVRLLLVLLVGPPLSRLVARQLGAEIGSAAGDAAKVPSARTSTLLARVKEDEGELD